VIKRVSIKEIAKKAGVSSSTVSFVLNGKAEKMRISKALEEKILASAKKEGYVANPIAVSLRTGKSKVIGVLVENISGSFFGSLSKVIEQKAHKAGYRLIYAGTENDNAKAVEMLQMLTFQQVDGFLITPTPGIRSKIENLVGDKPVVYIDSYFPGQKSPYVLVDNYEGVAMAIEHMAAGGYKKIGFVSVSLGLAQMKDRLTAFKEAIAEKGLKAEKKRILQLPFNNSKDDLVKKVSAFIKGNPDMDAIFFATNYLGIIGLKAIKNLGLKIPDDLAIVCFDDHEVFDLYTPGITVVEQPAKKIAEQAMAILLNQLDDKRKEADMHVLLPPKLVIRESAAAHAIK
jgi:LacI family transcriptional regulator